MKTFIQAPLVAVASADTPITASTTLTAITGLTLPVVAGATYRVCGHIWFTTAGTASGVKLGISAPGTPTLLRASGSLRTAAGASSVGSVLSAEGTLLDNALAAAGTHAFEFEGLITASDAGNVVLQIAQKTSDAGAVTAEDGSLFVLERIVDRPDSGGTP
jgi:hypothetical protein